MASPARSAFPIRFGPFEVDPANERLRKSGTLLKLHPQPFNLLLLLLAQPGQVVTRKEIERRLWNGNILVDSEGGINFCVKQLRAALGDNADRPKYVETLPRRGYRFIAPVTYSDSPEHVLQLPSPSASDASARSGQLAPQLSPSPVIVANPPSLAIVPGRGTRSLRKAAIVALPLAAILLAAGFFYARHRAPKLTEKDTVVLGDFTNNTGEPVFDGALKQALTVGLNQSPFLNLLPDKKITETLRLMGRSPFDRVTPEIAEEICLRTGSQAYLNGTISRLGSAYLLDVNAVACNSGTLLASSQAQARNKEDVLKVLSRTTVSLRSKLGESLPSVEKYDVPIEATTTSLEALQNMSIATRVGAAKSDAASLPFVQRALEYDPNFATAYAALARRYQNLDQPQLALENATKAFELRDHVSEREQFEIASIYFRAKGDLENLTRTVELWKVTYPRDGGPHGRLCINYQFLGQYEKARVECQEALRLDPAQLINYDNLAGIYMNMNRYDDAQRVCELALARHLACPWKYFLAFVRGDSAGMAKELSAAMGQPDGEDLLLSAQSDTYFYYGQVALAREFSRRASESALRSGFRETAALWRIKSALCEAELGDRSAAKRGASEALQLSSGRFTRVLAAVALARVGDTMQSRKLVKQLEQSDPANTLLKIYWLPVIDAAVQLELGNPSNAFVSLQTAEPYDLALPSPNEIGTLYPVYLRGQAYLATRNGKAGTADFQKILHHQGITLNFVNGALARLGLARAYVLQGDTAKARAAYQDFFALWKDADPDIPILKQAKAEYAKLQ
jgi:eukaryotic-like serine/threonine-protein kinase